MFLVLFFCFCQIFRSIRVGRFLPIQISVWKSYHSNCPLSISNKHVIKVYDSFRFKAYYNQ
ncbi:hypothetical protein KC19_9G087500 [Ceratodon purpureus]|uniref:Secreted protein n=1 Tax=Ceratodon purpureus TaxID=3225 RepID=A0A8T0GTP5_CERPU|nr:hypothetical protein KC19_9G087500 [Ceratodon purpureus]